MVPLPDAAPCSRPWRRAVATLSRSAASIAGSALSRRFASTAALGPGEEKASTVSDSRPLSNTCCRTGAVPSWLLDAPDARAAPFAAPRSGQTSASCSCGSSLNRSPTAVCASRRYMVETRSKWNPSAWDVGVG
eukprot:scaffold655_cov225-Pinguiococcus_pyrenoidosus.AAC.13